VAGAGVKERLIFLVARTYDLGVGPIPTAIEVPVTRIAPTVWITVGAILRFKVLVHWLPPQRDFER